MTNKTGMWELPIVEMKIGGINGISFRKNQTITILGEKVTFTHLMRQIDELGEEVFMVFAKKEGNDEDYLLKLSKGEPVYCSFDIKED